MFQSAGGVRRGLAMQSLALHVICRCLVSMFVLAGAAAVASGNGQTLLRGPSGSEVRALIVGVDTYSHYRPLKGAVADARDIEAALRRMGAKDITTLINTEADRASILREIDRLTA